jgi:hypothetical protein
LLIDTVVCLTLAKWETVSGRFGGYLTDAPQTLEVGDRLGCAQALIHAGLVCRHARNKSA